jgi:(E)-2-((N-methylformamido)methylene)succinate hydrolase
MLSRPKIVLLHGVGLDRRMWQPLSALLEPEFEVDAIDLLGHGASMPAPVGTTLTDLANDVIAKMTGKVHLVGFSLGALVAQRIAATRPDLLLTVTSVSSVCLRTDEERKAVLNRLSSAAHDFETSVEESIKRWFPEESTAHERLRTETRKVLLANDLASYLNCYRVFATGDAEIAPELERIAVPALAITGERDTGSTPAMTRKLSDLIPDCRPVIVPSTGHMLPVQKPRELAEALTSFIKEKSYV